MSDDNVQGKMNIESNQNPSALMGDGNGVGILVDKNTHQILHSTEGMSRKRKQQPTETIDLSTSSDDEDIISGLGQVNAVPNPFSNKARNIGNPPTAESTDKNDTYKKSAATAATVETCMNGTRNSTQKEDHLLPNKANRDSNNSDIFATNKDNSNLKPSSVAPSDLVADRMQYETNAKSDDANRGQGSHSTISSLNRLRNLQNQRKPEISHSDGAKSDLGLLKRSNDGSRVLHNDSDDSSSTSSDLRKFMRLDAGFSSKSLSNTNNTKDESLSELTTYNNAVDTLDSDSDSSLEVVNAPRHRLDSPSPSGRKTNHGRHLSGRQRRLEAARSKNVDGDTTSPGIVDLITIHCDDSNNVTSSDKEKSEEYKSKQGEDPSDSTLSISTAMSVSKSQDAAFTGKKEVVQLEYTNMGREAISTKASGTPAVESRKSTKDGSESCIENNDIDDNGVSDYTIRDKDESNLSKVNQTNNYSSEEILDQTTALTTNTTSSTSGIFDNLHCNGKDFFSWARIVDPKDFLYRNDLAQHVNEWRKTRNLPPFNDSIGFLKRLKSQVLDNMKSLGIEIPSIQDNFPTPNQVVVVAHPTNKNKKKTHSSFKDMPMKGEDFLFSLGIKNPEDFLQRKDLSKFVNPWRQQINVPTVKDPTWHIWKWKKHVREHQRLHSAESKTGMDDNYNEREDKNNYVSDSNNDDEFPNCMALVSALSKRFLDDRTGLPVYQFAVYDTLSDDIIYQFRVEAKKSLIEGAGNGAFITYLGARESRQRLTQNLDTASQVKIIQPLVAKDSDGYHTNIKIVGEHLQRQNRRYPLPTSLPPMHVLSENSINDKYPWNLESEGNRLLTDFVENPLRLFTTGQRGCSTIDLGRYGPFRRSDRKVLVHYEIKNFIFSNEVSEWGFDLREDFRGEEQVADITDDTTGIPHDIARQNISMYVNETGGDPELKQTVFSGQVLDREVNYYFKTERPMKSGDNIELLISYLHTYDEIRERKGYGDRNKKGVILGDDHFPTFLERNFVERYDMVEVIYEVKDEMDLYQLSEFLEGIREKLAKIMDTFIRELQSSSKGLHVPNVQQMIALRRLNWLKPFFVKKIESFKKKIEKSRKTDISSCFNLVIQQCTENAKRLDWASWPILLDLLHNNPNLVDNKCINVRSKFRDEVTEDICYGVSSSLFCPCHEAIWCDVTANLIHELCFSIARNRWDYGKVKTSSRLSEILVQKAIEASKAIQNPDNLDALKFDTAVWKRYSLKGGDKLSKQSCGTKCLLTMASDCSNPENKPPAPIILTDDSSVMEQRNIFKMIHTPWYLSRQIIFVVDTFAKKYLAKDETLYSFDALCKEVGVSSELASEFLKRDIKLDVESPLFYGKDFKAIYSKGNKLSGSMDRTIKTRKTGSKSMPVRKLLFWNIIVSQLKMLGWKIAKGYRECDWYLLPPGVERGRGFKPRIDFFDSAPLVIKCLKTDIRYCDLPEIKKILVEYHLCQTKYEEMKGAKDKFIKNSPTSEIVDFLKKSVMGEVSPQQRHHVKDIVFNKPRLGLMLEKIGSRVVVKDVQNQDYTDQIQPGDVLISVGDDCVRDRSLRDVVTLLTNSGRPLNVRFEYN